MFIECLRWAKHCSRQKDEAVNKTDKPEKKNSTEDLIADLQNITGVTAFEKKNVSFLFTCIELNSELIKDSNVRKKIF